VAMTDGSSRHHWKEAFTKLPPVVQGILAASALIVAGIAVAAAAIWQKEYAETHWTPNRVWVELAVFSALTAGAILQAFKRRWRRARFWVTFVGVMLVRTAIYAAVLRQLPELPLIVFLLVTMLDIQVLMAVLFRLNYGSTDVTG
jgi:hypothetical protein